MIQKKKGLPLSFASKRIPSGFGLAVELFAKKRFIFLFPVHKQGKKAGMSAWVGGACPELRWPT
ncbi:MAG: hypothetical protein HC913_23845 [Microscillaceae bacterium]|nr:hypothetical protein [Microscillaceae bacterium]